MQGKEVTGPASGCSSDWMIIELDRFAYKRDETVYLGSAFLNMPLLKRETDPSRFSLWLLKIDRLVVSRVDTFFGGIAA